MSSHPRDESLLLEELPDLSIIDTLLKQILLEPVQERQSRTMMLTCLLRNRPGRVRVLPVPAPTLISCEHGCLKSYLNEENVVFVLVEALFEPTLQMDKA
jgi:hypothetical protein